MVSSLLPVDPLIVVVACGAFAIATFILKPWRKKYRTPPYPWTPFPIVGNAIQLLRSKKRAYELFYEISKTMKFGKIFMLRIGSMDVAVLNHIDVVQEALLQKSNDFAGRPRLYTTELFCGGNNNIVFGQNGPSWRLLRKFAHSALRKYASGKHLEQVTHSSVNKTVDEILKEGDKPFDPRTYMSLLMFNLLSGICFGKICEKDDKDFLTMRSRAIGLIDLVGRGLLADFIPWLRFLQTKKARQVMKAGERFRQLMKKELDEHKAKFDPGNISDIADYLLLMQWQSKKDTQNKNAFLTDTDILMTLFDIYGAANDTTVNTLVQMVGYMVSYPNVQKKVQDEVQRVIGDRPPAIEDRVDLPYTEATVYECMRKSTRAVFGVPLATTTDTTIHGFDLPKKTTVIVNFWALNNDPDHWEDPHEFRSERFLDAEGHLAPNPPSFLPYSAGRRVCLGEDLSRIKLMIIFPMLLQRLTFKPPPGKNFVLQYEDRTLGNVNKTFEIVAEPNY